MNIAYLTTDFGIPVHGNKGSSIHVREFSDALAGQGHRVEIVTCRAGGDPPVGFAVPVHEMRLGRPERRIVSALQDDPAAGQWIAKEVRSMLYAATLREAAFPMLERLRPDAIYERYSLLSTAGIELARELRVPHILEVNAPLSDEHARHRGIGFSQTVRATEQQILGATDRIVAVSSPLKQWIIGTGIDPDRVTVLPNGVRPERFASDDAGVHPRLFLGDRPVVGFVGTLKAWHGTPNLIRAVGQIAAERGLDQAPRLLIVGDGPQRNLLEQVANDEGIASLTIFTGSVPHSDISAHIAAMDIAIAPYDASPDFYFSPLKLFEYMAAGRPTVAADIGQIRDCLHHNTTGLLYPPGDIGALAREITALLDDPARARALGVTARDHVQRHHSWSRNARVVTNLIEAERELRHPRSRSTSAVAGGQ